MPQNKSNATRSLSSVGVGVDRDVDCDFYLTFANSTRFDWFLEAAVAKSCRCCEEETHDIAATATVAAGSSSRQQAAATSATRIGNLQLICCRFNVHLMRASLIKTVR